MQGEAKEYLIRKDGYFYRPNCQGYTTRKIEAGRYTKAKAEAEAAVEPWHMSAVHQDDVPDEPAVADLNAEIARLQEHVETLTARLATAYRRKAECNDDANAERHLRLAAETERDRLRKMVLRAADQCDKWVKETYDGGWSTHQVQGQRALAESLRLAALQKEPQP